MFKVSVIMSVYNGARYLADAIDSILNQTYTDFEFIIINDGSTDNTAGILESYTAVDNRVRVLVNSSRLGLTLSLNKAIREARGVYIARMDADDISNKNRIAEQLNFFGQYSDVAVLGTSARIINENGKEIGIKSVLTGHKDIVKKMLFNNQFIHGSLMIKKSVFDDVGFYDETFKNSQDYELLLRAARKYTVANLDKKLIYRREHIQNISLSSKRQQYDAIRARWRAVKKYGYPFWDGIGNICVRFVLFCLPLKLKNFLCNRIK
ncbi:MAG: glycosyltransferase [Candidatus Magasanikbacteria bacterium]